ncbi:MAG TPA: DUF4012 domain-containing protein [Acidimicrobiales bacterium]|nr:DUF4012 domain-containing protein [Acidimicrobiales bacterium]
MKRTARARDRLRGSLPLQIAGLVPGLSTQRTGLVRSADIAAEASAVAAGLAAEADRNADAIALRGGAVDVAALVRFADDAKAAATRIQALPRAHASGQWGLVAKATRDLDREVADAGHRLSTGAGTLRATAGLLGADGPRRFFVALQNNAEMRDQGMVLQYAVAETADGRLNLARRGRVTEIELARPISDITLSPGTQSVFGSLAPLQLWQSVNAFADSELSGRAMISMYRQATGEAVDGVIALDVPALAEILGVTGPVTIPGIPEPINRENAGRVLLNDLYAADRTLDQSDRRERLADVAAAVTERLQNSAVDAAGLADALGRAAAGGHLRVTSVKASEQKAFVAAGLAGGPGAQHPERTIHVSVQNGTATKLDYFVRPKITFDVSVTPDDAAVVRATVTIPNTAPVPTPPSFQFGPDKIVQFTPGLYKARTYFWGPRGSDQLNSAEDSGLNLSWGAIDVPAGQTKELSFTTVIPQAVQEGVLRLRFVPQPRLEPAEISISVSGIGRRIATAPNVAKDWDRTLDLKWKLSSAS